MARQPGIKKRIFANLKHVPPLLLLRLLVTSFFLLPGLVVYLGFSFWKIRHFRKIKIGQRLIARHPLAFEGFDPESLEIKPQRGGVSNGNYLWALKDKKGNEVRFFVKVFVWAGSFWARNLTLLSPFPPVYGGRIHERFTVDIVSRVQLDDIGVPVPKLIAYDPVDQVMITEYLNGVSVDQILEGIARRNSMTPEDKKIIHLCAEELAKVHQGGFSLIDTQPVNCMWVEDEKKVYFTDLEFTTRQDFRVWDVGFFLCFLIVRLPENLAKEVRRLFVECYQVIRPLDFTEVSETHKTLEEYLPIFSAILDVRKHTPEELFQELIS